MAAHADSSASPARRVLAALLLGGAAAAQAASPSVSGRALSDGARLTAYEDNYAVWQRMRTPGWAAPDEAALRARISFKYTFCGPPSRASGSAARGAEVAATPADSMCPTSGRWRDTELYFAYTAEFDFYAGTRPSGPVIGRVNAPGLFVRLPARAFLGSDWQADDGLELGLQHRSDGQTTEVDTPRDAETARQRYALGDHRYFDTISRGANFLLVGLDKQVPKMPPGQALLLRARLRLYLGTQDADVTWGPRAGTGSRFSDYDRLEWQAWWTLNERLKLDAQWRVGDRGAATDSWTLGLEFKALGVPWYLRYHRGPMNTLSNYTQRQDSLGLGLRFTSF